MSEAMVGLSEQELQQIETNYELHLRLVPNRICPTGDHPADIEARLAAEVRRLRAALAEVMLPIEALTVAGDDAWELAPEVRAELIVARTLGRAALFGTPPRMEPAAQRD